MWVEGGVKEHGRIDNSVHVDFGGQHIVEIVGVGECGHSARIISTKDYYFGLGEVKAVVYFLERQGSHLVSLEVKGFAIDFDGVIAVAHKAETCAGFKENLAEIKEGLVVENVFVKDSAFESYVFWVVLGAAIEVEAFVEAFVAKIDSFEHYNEFFWVSFFVFDFGSRGGA